MWRRLSVNGGDQCGGGKLAQELAYLFANALLYHGEETDTKGFNEVLITDGNKVRKALHTLAVFFN